MHFHYRTTSLSCFINEEMESVGIGFGFDDIVCDVRDIGEFESGFRMRFRTPNFVLRMNCRDFKGVRILNNDESEHAERLTIEEKYELLDAIQEIRNSILKHNLTIQFRRTLEMLGILQYAAGLYSDQF